MKMWLNLLKCAHFAVHVIIIEKDRCSYGCSLQCHCDHYREWHFQTDFQSAVTVALGENKHCKLCSRSRLKRLLVCLFQGALGLLSLVQQHRIQLLKQCDMKFFRSRFFYFLCFKVWASGFRWEIKLVSRWELFDSCTPSAVKEVLCSFGGEIKTQNFNTYNVN